MVDGFGTVRDRAPLAIAVAAVASCRTPTQQPIGRITVSMTTARAYADEVKRLLEVERAGGPRRHGAGVDARAAAADVRMPDEPGADVTIAEREYRTTCFPAAEPDGTQIDGAPAHAGAAARTTARRSS